MIRKRESIIKKRSVVLTGFLVFVTLLIVTGVRQSFNVQVFVQANERSDSGALNMSEMATPEVYGELVDSGIDYTEILDEIDNPERGFYSHRNLVMRPEGSDIKTISQVRRARQVIHLRIDIGAFGRKADPDERDFTKDMLDALNQTMENIRAEGKTAIVRFAYDWSNYYKDGDYNGYEPEDMSQILRHVEQLSDFFHENEDVITAVEGGFIGPYGEQHSSPLRSAENLNLLIEGLLEAVPESRTISVRKPETFANWTGIALGEIDQFVANPGTPAYRVGIYNDGYLGSHSDMGTYRDREIETRWLSHHGLHTLFGGEAVGPHTGPLTNENTVEHATEEMFITRTSYLNIAWRREVLDRWRETEYEGSNDHYHGVSGFDFINNHLGYRFVIRDSRLTQSVALGEELILNAQIENVGAGNKVNETELTVLFVCEETGEIVHYERTNVDIRNWNSQTVSDVELNIGLSDVLQVGDYHIYFKMTRPGFAIDNNDLTIRFANQDVWNEELGANFMGSFQLIE